MYIFLPFNINKWYEGEQLSLERLFGTFTCCGMIALGVSQFGLAKLRQRLKLTNATYLFWFLGELILVAATVTIADVMLTDIFFFTWSEFINTLRYTALIMPLPYFIALLWFYTREKIERLRTLENTAPAIPVVQAQAEVCLPICDENNRTVLSVHPGKLLLMKAEDNYVHVFYMAAGVTQKELIRTSLKKLEGELSGHGFVRAHRSYLVNMSKVVFFRKTSKGHQLQLDGMEDLTVPVSGSYLDVFKEHFAPAS